MVNRIITLPNNYSFFLFGARGTGKSTLLKEKFSNALYLDLLEPEIEARFLREPQSLKNLARQSTAEWIVVDEVQKVPELLSVVHQLIETKKYKFALTGSSARKLKRGGADLLAGRAFLYSLFPFTHNELNEDFNLDDILQYGSLPQIYSFQTSNEKEQFLQTYARMYLKEEVVAEQLIRKLQPFYQFLEIAAQHSGKLINFSAIAKDVHVDTVTVQSYFQILEDTLLGFTLQPFHQSIRKRQRTNPKFYFFDLGVKRALDLSLKIPIQPHSSVYGDLFEQFLITEIHRLIQYKQNDYRLSFLRTKDNVEIDLIIERPGLPLALVEIKSATQINSSMLNSFSKIANDFGKYEAFCLSNDPLPQRFGNVTALPWKDGLIELGLA